MTSAQADRAAFLKLCAAVCELARTWKFERAYGAIIRARGMVRPNLLISVVDVHENLSYAIRVFDHEFGVANGCQPR